MGATPQPVFLLGLDRTLLDADRFAVDLRARLKTGLGSHGCDRYQSLHARRRRERGCADYLGALHDLRTEAGGADSGALAALRSFLLGYPYWARLYPHALDALRHLGRQGPTVLCSAGDIELQTQKIRRSGLFDAVEGRAFVCRDREGILDMLQWGFPAERYVVIDASSRFLAAAKRELVGRVTTVQVCQGLHAVSAAANDDVAPDITIPRVGDLLAFGAS